MRYYIKQVSQAYPDLVAAPLKRPEGDLEKNAKLWYKQVEPSTLSIFWGEDDPAASAKENMYRIMSVKSGNLPREKQEKEEEHARKVKWEEMVCVFKHLESSFGWGQVDGTTVYTRDEDPSHKSMVLGTLRSPLLLLQARFVSCDRRPAEVDAGCRIILIDWLTTLCSCEKGKLTPRRRIPDIRQIRLVRSVDGALEYSAQRTKESPPVAVPIVQLVQP